MKIYRIKILFLFLVSISIFPQSRNSRITIVGNTLEGSRENGKNIRKVIGNVVMTQDNVKITCDIAIQDVDRNEAELIGNVVATQDTIIIKTQRAYYYGEKKYALSKTPVSLFDGHVTLTAKSGYYYFDEDKAVFSENVKLVDTANTMISKKLTYFNNEDKAIATGNVSITDGKVIILADSLNHSRNEKYTNAFFNIKIIDSQNNSIITGTELLNDGIKNHTVITGKPIFTQIDTSKNGEIDTLFIFSKVMESFDDSTKKFLAKDSVKIIRQNFYSISNYAVLFRNEDKIFTYKREDDKTPPVMWYEESQLVGDSIYVYLKNNTIDLIKINRNAFILSQQKDYPNRYNQISGDSIYMYFYNDELKRTEVYSNVLSIYYLFEDEETNGLLKSSSEKAKLFFADKKITDVKLFGSILSEYHPENLIKGKELEFTLPNFILYSNKPNKNKLTFNIPNFR
ncbi:MAG: OstA-like protein [Ignavibacteriales bacterium]